MINLLLIIFMYMFISMLLMIINFNLSKKKIKMREKLTSFECGFDNISNLRLPFSIQFYLISIIFLIFDIEITLIFPMIKNLNMNFIMKKYIFLWIMIILLIGIYYEWKEGSLKWIY
uniref:NADH-ubiquinone oxidoreductase chain 3 n=1 Tax=Ibalia leucospoides TaxID=32408 RepID=A0A0E3DQR7_9HYME|nr:NADH dehydrogenase subunit 3 [Ibalia leucospoides]AIK21703.1 NADH dehydrogenase subunit 3 [Ibalia leucospoides]